MKNENRFILIRFFTRSGQELGALFPDKETCKLRISGLYSDKALKTFTKCEKLPSEVSEKSLETVKKSLKKSFKIPVFL